MSKRKLILFSLLVIALVLGGSYLRSYLNIINGYAAKTLASEHFVAKREVEEIKRSDLDFFPIKYSSCRVNVVQNIVDCTLFGMARRFAYANEDGATLVPITVLPPTETKEVAKRIKPVDTMLRIADSAISLPKTQKHAFLPNPERGGRSYTKALLVSYKGHLIYEKYANDSHMQMPMLGWSMSKSILSLAVGAYLKETKDTITQNDVVPIWTLTDKKEISLENLIQMRSGLKWDEDYNNISEVTLMLYEEKETNRLIKKASYNRNKPFQYNSGNTNLVSEWLSSKFYTHEEFNQFLRTRLFNPLGMSTVYAETNMDQMYIASSYTYMRARDFHKLGLLISNGGQIGNNELVSPHYIQWMKKAAIGSNGRYGGGVWLNKSGNLYPSVPSDLIMFKGFNGQRVIIIPSEEIVITKLGMSKETQISTEKLISNVLSDIKEQL